MVLHSQRLQIKMRLEGKTFRGTYIDRIVVVERAEEHLRFSKQLENCLLQVCKDLDVSPPLWMEKNTSEFAKWHQTVFHAEQFMERVPFNRLEIKWIEE